MKNINPNLNDFVETWNWVNHHPHYFSVNGLPNFAGAYEVLVVKKKNGKPCVWIESGSWYSDTESYHDPSLDVSAPTFEKAVLKLGKRLMKKYGDYPEHRHCSHCLLWRPAGKTDENEYWFCSDACAECGPVKMRTEPTESGLLRWVGPRGQFSCEHWRDR